jgi:hypothetical protein
MASHAFAPDNYDSDDDSEFGFDDGLSSDEVLRIRIAEMRNMMKLTTDSDSDDTPVKTAATAPAPAPAASPEAKEAEKPVVEKPDVVDDDEFLMVDARSPKEEHTPEKTEAVTLEPAPRRPDEEDDLGEDVEEEEDDDEEYVVTWAKGQLGLLFKEGPRGETVIRRINKRSSSAEGLHVARVSDVLVAVNDERVGGRSCQDIVEQLRLPEFPITLTFRPHTSGDDDDDDENENDTQIIKRASEQPNGDMARKESAQSVLSTTSSTPTTRVTPLSTSIGPNGHAYPSSGLGPSPAYRLQPQAVPPPPTYGSVAAGGAAGSTPYSRSHTLDDTPGPGEYDVVWRQGTLGCGVKKSNGMPTIKSVTPGAAVDASVQQIAPGDVMIAINGLDTETIGFRAVVETMQRAPKPLFMRFRRAGQVVIPPRTALPPYGQPPLSRPSRYENSDFENLRDSSAMEDLLPGGLTSRQYTVLWNDGPLGVQIKPRPSDGSIVVTKFTGTGNPDLLAPISLGDLFVRIAGLEVAELGISGTCEKLKTVHKPVVLVFERPFPGAAPLMPPPLSPAPPPPVSAPVVRQGFAADDLQDSVVPSFRELREREAAANQDRYRDSFSGFTAEQRGENIFGATGRRAALAKHRPASYDTMDDTQNVEGRRSRHSFPTTDNSSTDGHHLDRSSDPSGDHSGERSGGVVDALPRFSDIEKGRVKTTAVASLPPPPAYHDTFTQSGRFLDPNQFGDAPQPPSPHSEGRPGSSVSSGQSRLYGGAPPPAYPQNYGYTAPTPPRQTPPAYEQYNYGAGGGGHGGSQRIDVLRQQYIESERVRNQSGMPREGAMTEMSTYSDLDDSGIMAAMRRPADRGSRSQAPLVRHQPSLPAPELWIQWKEGPLGITFRRTNGQIVVSRLTGAGYSRGLEQLRAGDWLVSFGNPSVGSYATSELRLAETMELIKSLPKPVDMRFVVR